MVVIKKVEDQNIYLEERVKEYRNSFAMGMGMLITLVIATIMFVGVITPAGGPSGMFQWLLVIIICCVFGGLAWAISGMFSCFDIGAKKIVYLVVSSPSAGRVSIEKTGTPEDTIAVCRAAKEIEQEILKQKKEERKLEEIAKKCQ